LTSRYCRFRKGFPVTVVHSGALHLGGFTEMGTNSQWKDDYLCYVYAKFVYKTLSSHWQMASSQNINNLV